MRRARREAGGAPSRRRRNLFSFLPAALLLLVALGLAAPPAALANSVGINQWTNKWPSEGQVVELTVQVDTLNQHLFDPSTWSLRTFNVHLEAVTVAGKVNAVEGEDFELLDKIVTVVDHPDASQSKAKARVRILDDALAEGTEHFHIGIVSYSEHQTGAPYSEGATTAPTRLNDGTVYHSSQVLHFQIQPSDHIHASRAVGRAFDYDGQSSLVSPTALTATETDADENRPVIFEVDPAVPAGSLTGVFFLRTAYTDAPKWRTQAWEENGPQAVYLQVDPSKVLKTHADQAQDYGADYALVNSGISECTHAGSTLLCGLTLKGDDNAEGTEYAYLELLARHSAIPAFISGVGSKPSANHGNTQSHRLWHRVRVKILDDDHPNPPQMSMNMMGAGQMGLRVERVSRDTAPIAKYEVRVEALDGSGERHERTVAVEPDHTEATLTVAGLQEGIGYGGSARAVTADGTRGRWSEPVEATKLGEGGEPEEPEPGGEAQAEDKAGETQTAEKSPAEPGPVEGLGGMALAAGSETVELSPAFAPETLAYRAEAPAGAARVTLTPTWGGTSSVFAGSRAPGAGGASYTRPRRVRPSGTAVELNLAPDGQPTELWVMVIGPGGTRTYEIEAVKAQEQEQTAQPQEQVQEQAPPEREAEPQRQEPQQQQRAPLTASFERAPAEHAGSDSFWLNLRFSEALGEGGKAPAAASFEVRNGRVKRVRQLEPGLWRVRLAPSSWRDVVVTLAGGRACDAEGAVCAADGRALSNTSSASIGGPARIRLAGGKAREGAGATIDFSVTLNRAASGPVSVDYATKDGTATAGEDYTATSGTLTFAVGETEKTVTVALLDDAHDEGKETFTLVLSKPRGAYLRGTHKEAKGTIRNADPMQRAWLGRFGRTVAADAIAAVTARFETPREAGSHLTLAGQRLSGEGAALAQAVTGLARAFGAEEAADGRVTAPGRSMSAREFLRGTSFRAVLGGGGSRFTGWGSGAAVSRFSGAAPELSLSGETATGVMGMDYERGRLLTGLAMTHSLGEGTAEGSGRSYAVGSSVTTMLPYARFEFSDRVSAWSLAGTGKGKLTLELGDAAESHGTDLSMTLAAAGVRGEVVRPAAAGGFTLAVKADAYWVRTESDGVSAPGVGNLAEARADASRVRAVLDGSRTFLFGGGGMLTPSMELGVRHDGGHEGKGTGMEVGARLGYADPGRGLDAALRVHGLAARADDDYREWGVSGSLRLVPGASGRGLSMSLTPSWGADPGGPERLWAAPEASGLAAKGEAARTGRLDAELGYGMAVLGGRFTGTPNVGFGVSETAREYRMGWRLVSASHGGFALSLDATRRVETADGGEPAEHRVMLGGTVRW